MLFRRYSPAALVVDWYLTPVSLLLAVTAAPAMAAPLVSVTAPTMMLSLACPRSRAVKQEAARRLVAKNRMFISAPSRKFFPKAGLFRIVRHRRVTAQWIAAKLFLDR